MTEPTKELYALTRFALGEQTEIEIDAESYADVVSALAVMEAALDAEQVFDVLISNFLEFEQELLCQTLEHSIRNLHPDTFFSQLLSSVGA